MHELLLELVGKNCEVKTHEDYYEGTIIKIQGDWLVVVDGFEQKECYINIRHIDSIIPNNEELGGEKEKKKGLFRRKNKPEEF